VRHLVAADGNLVQERHTFGGDEAVSKVFHLLTPGVVLLQWPLGHQVEVVEPALTNPLNHGTGSTVHFRRIAHREEVREGRGPSRQEKGGRKRTSLVPMCG